jgi:hypothetical protein
MANMRMANATRATLAYASIRTMHKRPRVARVCQAIVAANPDTHAAGAWLQHPGWVENGGSGKFVSNRVKRRTMRGM